MQKFSVSNDMLLLAAQDSLDLEWPSISPFQRESSISIFHVSKHSILYVILDQINLPLILVT